MRRSAVSPLSLALGLILPLVLGPARAVGQPDSTRFISVDEIQPGMTGIGYSVFSGAGLESFEVEVIDVMRQSGPRRNMVLAELRGEVVDEAGIISGMSGSPVYIDGRLMGAVAYGWAFSKRPIAGITPIGEMLAIMDHPEPVAQFSALPPPDMPMPTDVITEALNPRPVTTPIGDLQPIRVPLLVSGLSPAAHGMLSDHFGPLGFNVVQGGAGGSAAGDPDPSFRPGDPVAIPLVQGDASIAAFGTITYADGDRLVAFGHPVFHTGGQRLPLAGGRVLTVLPSVMQSFKFALSDEPAGYFYSDRTPGAAGRLGTPPPMLPVELQVESPVGTQSYAYEVVRDRFLTASMLQAIIMNTMVSDLHRSGLGTMTSVVTIHLNDGTEIRHADQVATVNAPDMLSFQAAGPVAQLVNNPYVEPHIERVSITTKLEEEVRISSIERVEVLDRPARAGETVRILVTLRPYRGKFRDVTLELPIPVSAPVGTAVLKVCDRISLDAWDRERAPDKYRPRDFAAFLSQLQDMPSHDQIEARLYSSGMALVVEGEEMPSLPPSMARALTYVNATGGRSLAEGVEVATVVLDLNEHVLGCHTLTLEVEER